MTVASLVWDIVGNDCVGGDNGLSSVGIRPGDGGAFLVLKRWRRELISVVRCSIQPSRLFVWCSVDVLIQPADC
jgi:hypothetical protein